MHATVAIVGTTFDEASVFVSPLTGSEDAWFSIGGPYLTAYIMGSFLICMSSGDMTGSFFKREGDVFQSPSLDTLPFAIMVFWGQLFWTIALASSDLLLPMALSL